MHKQKITIVAVSVGLILSFGVTTYALMSQKPTASERTLKSNDTAQSGDDSTPETAKSYAKESQVPEVISDQSSVNRSNQTQPNAYTPQPISLDKNTYVADGYKIIGKYSEILTLLTFPATATEEDKIRLIKQAYQLDREDFNLVTRLRSHTVSAEVESGVYIDLADNAENAASSISVGVASMKKWSENTTDDISYNTGRKFLEKGASELLQFANQLKKL